MARARARPPASRWPTETDAWFSERGDKAQETQKKWHRGSGGRGKIKRVRERESHREKDNQRQKEIQRETGKERKRLIGGGVRPLVSNPPPKAGRGLRGGWTPMPPMPHEEKKERGKERKRARERRTKATGFSFYCSLLRHEILPTCVPVILPLGFSCFGACVQSGPSKLIRAPPDLAALPAMPGRGAGTLERASDDEALKLRTREPVAHEAVHPVTLRCPRDALLWQFVPPVPAAALPAVQVQYDQAGVEQGHSVATCFQQIPPASGIPGAVSSHSMVVL